MELRKSYFADVRKDDLHEIGQPRPRSDSPGHVTGKTAFFADRNFPGMLHLKMVRSPHHHARIRSIDTSEAEKHPGVVKILTAKDVPHNVYPILILIQIGPEDETVLADGKVRWKGEAVVAVLAETERAAQEAAAKVKTDYEVLPAVFDMEEALKPGAPLVNEYHGQNYYLYDSGECRKVRFGDVESGFAGADHILAAGVGRVVEQHLGGHDHAWRAEAALRGEGIEESALQRMQNAGLGQTGGRADVGAAAGFGQRQAGQP